jgi:general L-amino acid transport system permease protein
MTAAASLPRPIVATGPLGWLKENLFSTWYNGALTVLAIWFLYYAAGALMNWVFLNAVWSGPPQACRDVQGTGACWAGVYEKHRFILFGTYTYAEQWRPLVALISFFTMGFASCFRFLWNRWLFLAWLLAIVAVWILMAGGILGLSSVPNAQWGGLPLTLILSVVGIGAAFPLGVALALGRRSDMPAIKALCVVYIETIRGVPLISVLFMASVMFPLFLPEGVTIDKLLRAQVGIILFTAAYLAEVVRAGLQAIPNGQFEAADSLGLNYWQKIFFIILPQALKLVIPPIVNSFIATFKDTSLVIVIGLFDLLNTARTAMIDPLWRAYQTEAYIFAALIYFGFCFFMSRYSQYLERILYTGQKRR